MIKNFFRISYILMLFSLFSQSAFSQIITLNSDDNYNKTSNVDVSGFEIQLNISEINFKDIKTEKGIYSKLFINSYSKNFTVGEPELPIYRKLIEIPGNADITYEIESIQDTVINLNKLGINNKLFPAQKPVTKDKDYKKEFTINKELYSTNSYYKLQTIDIKKLGKMRATNIARLSISPVSYNPVKNSIRIITNIKLKVEFKNYDVSKIFQEKIKYYSSVGNNVSSHLLNAEPYMIIPPQSVQYPLKYVIVADSMFKSTLQPFVKWKNREGYKVIEAYTQNSNVGNTTTSIKSYLQSLYNSATPSDPAPSYVLFVGDIAQVPAFNSLGYGNHVTDLHYCEYTNDFLPEMQYGRFSATNTTELQAMIDKTLLYEEYLMSDPSYLGNALLVAGHDYSYAPTHGNGQINYASNNYFNSTNGINALVHLHPNSSTNASLIRSQANNVGFINYTAHGNYNGWADPSFTNSDVPNMTNQGKYPVVITNACLTNKFNEAECFGEALLREANKGAVAHIGASNNTLWDEDYYWTVGYLSASPHANPTYTGTGLGFYDKLFHTHGEPRSDWAKTTSDIIYEGNIAVMQSGNQIEYYWEIYHTMGDPSLMPYLWEPNPVNTNYSSSILIGTSSYSVSTEPDALVALSINDSLVASAFADSLGNANLSFVPFTMPGQALLTVSGQNIQTTTYNVNIISPNGPYVIYTNHTINKYNKSNNNQLEFGDEISLNVDIYNITQFSADTLILKLRSNDSNIVITDSIEYYGFLDSNSSITLDSVFRFKADSLIPDLHNVHFNLVISDTSGGQWSSYFEETAYSPNIEIISLEFDDSQFGNNNNYIDANESFQFVLKAKNIGSINLNTISYFELIGDSDFNISPKVISPSFDKDVEKEFIFSVTSSSNIKEGEIKSFFVNFSCGKIKNNEKFVFVAGDVIENFETANFLKFDWINPSSSKWYIDNTYSNTGNYSAKSGTLPDDAYTNLKIELNVIKDDSISFYKKVSSEVNYDFLEFYIDDVLKGKWSGLYNWSKESYHVKKGIRTFKWSYVKDYYAYDYQDAAWIDDIKFPVTDALSSVRISTNNSNNFRVYPNPGIDEFTINMEIDKSNNFDIVIYNSVGKVIKTIAKSKFYNKGSNIINFNLNDFESGLYYIQITGVDYREIRKLIKL